MTPQEAAEDYAAAAHSLDTEQLVKLYGYNLLMAEKRPKWEGREERREILGRELVRRGVNPYYLTIEEFRQMFRFNSQDHDAEEQTLRACRNLLARVLQRVRERV
jgi:hypothetical protein